jgi:ABC-type uncharacterized transport system substrate-binding protein
VGTAAARFAREKSSSIPTVFAAVIDPSSTGLAPPGAPMDVDPAAEVAFVRKNFPQVKRLGVLYSPGRNVDAVSRFKALRDQGEAIALIEVPSIDKLEEAIQTLAEQSDGLLMLTDPVIYSPQTAPQLILKTLQRGLPIFAVSPAFVKAGAMAGIYTDPEQNGCTAAAVAGRVAAGDKAASRSYQLSSEYRSSANPVVAKRLNINLPAALAGGAEQTVK